MRFLLLASMVLSGMIAFGQAKNPALDALSRNDLNSLSAMLDDRVEICFDNRVQYLDKEATISAVRAFLSQNPPKSCAQMHTGASKGNASNYVIGSLASSNGKNFRVFIFVSEKGDKKIIQELKIDLQ